ncbi:protein TASOR 2 isoform X2 [Hoplias malabaricus]|uniref:protein TASOR 2 isoform X2 n=1 Tax=Hoplias malabaricus TaxID=27720 RepID=UPI0034637A14
MENDTILAKEGLLEPVLPGSVTFDNSILAPLQNNYLYKESKECFTYSSAYLINNATLQEKYSAFRAEKQAKGYSEKELEESFGFLLFDDESKANKLADTGLIVGQGTCTTLGDSSKGVYISKYSDCLDLKRWYDGKTGNIVILKLTKGRVKEVTENYTQKFTPPTSGFDCHVSDQLGAVCATTSSFLAFERTQYYMYELLEGRRSRAEPCPRHVCPFAVVAFSYGKNTFSLEIKEKSQEKSSFFYQPWSGLLKIESVLYNIGLESIHGALFPANLPKTVRVDHAIGVSELRKTLPLAVFETSCVGEVSLDGRCFSLYNVVSFEEKNDISHLTNELKAKDLALVVCLDDGGFLILLHSSHFLSYEGAVAGKAIALKGMFMFPDSRTVPRETKGGYVKPKVSPDVLQILPALNYAESEMEKCSPAQQEEPLGTVEKHLQNFATLILPGLSSSPAREASMFPDQYDVPDGFPLIAPKWTEKAGTRLKTYLENPCGFQIPVARALELLAAGKQQRSDDDHDDDVYYYISSPEEAPQTPANMSLEKDETDQSRINTLSDKVKTTEKKQPEKLNVAELSRSAVPDDNGTPGTMVVATSDNVCDRINASPKLGDLPEQCVSVHDECSRGPEAVTKETPIETPVGPLTENEKDISTMTVKASQHCEEEAEAEVDTSKNEECCSDILAETPAEDKEVLKEVSAPAPPENQTAALVEDVSKNLPPANTGTPPQRRLPRRRGKRRRKGFGKNLSKVEETQTSVENTVVSSSSAVSTPEQSGHSETVCSSSSDLLKKDWRSLPRRKKFWNANVNITRVLRSDVKSGENESIVEQSSPPTDPNATGKIVTSTPKRKMEGFCFRERYGLKTIVTDCGFVFVPHGSEIASGDIKPSKETKDIEDSLLVQTSSPANDKQADTTVTPPTENSELMPLSHIQNIPMDASANAPQQISEKESTSLKNSEPSLDSDIKKDKTKDSVYKAISISKLKTVLRRAKRIRDHGQSASDNAESELKKVKPNTELDVMQDKDKLSPNKSTKENNSTAVQNNCDLPASEEPSKGLELLSQGELHSSSSQDKLTPKENGLSGAFPQVPPPDGCVDSPQSLNSKPQLKLPDHNNGSVYQNKGDKNGWRHITSLNVSQPSTLLAKVRKPKLLHHRCIIEKEGSIQVGRDWKEIYDFRYDSKFTNDRLEKSVTRALHGKWDFSIEDNYEQVHLIFHMWIGLFYSKPTSRFFHFDNCLQLEKNDPPNVSDDMSPVQATSFSFVGSKEDGTCPPHPVSDILDLSVKVSDVSDNCTVSQKNSGESLTTSSETRSGTEHTAESEEPVRANLSHSSNVPPKLSDTVYRSTENLLEESPLPDDECSDTDNDTVTESSYTKILENNSAYSHLCEQASNMHIDEQKRLKLQQSAVVRKDQSMPEALKFKRPEKIPSGKVTGSDSKCTVFHQIIRPLKSVIFSKLHDQVPEKIHIHKAQSNKGKIGDGIPESTESVSKDKHTAALTDENVQSANDKDKSVFKTVEESRPASPVVTSHENDDAKVEEVKSVHDCVDSQSESVVIPRVNEVTADKVKDDTPKPVVIHDTPMHVVIDDTPEGGHVISDKAKETIKPMTADESAPDTKKDASDSVHNDEAKENAPMPEVRHDIPTLDVKSDISSTDMRKETPHNVCDISNERVEKNDVKPVQDVRDGTVVTEQELEENAEKGVTPTCVTAGGSSVNVQDGNVITNEARPKLDSPSVTECHDEIEGKPVPEENNENDNNKHVSEKSEEKICEKVPDEYNDHPDAQLICDANQKMESEKQNNIESLVPALEEADTCIELDKCNKRNADEETKGKVDKMSISDDEDLAKEMGCSSTDVGNVKLHEGEIKTETNIINSVGEQTSAQSEMTSDSSADHESLTAQELLKKKEAHSSTVGATCVPAECFSESSKFHHSTLVQNEIQAEPRRESGDVSLCTEVNANVDKTQNVDSSKNTEPQGKDTNQKNVPYTVCEMPFDKISKTCHVFDGQDSQDMSQLDLQINTEPELKSRSCTPTQDEMQYNHEDCKDSQDNHRTVRTLKRSPTIAGLLPDRVPLCPPTSSETHISNSPGHRAQSFPQGAYWSFRKHETTVKVTDERSSSSSEHVPKHNLFHFEHEAITPTRDIYSTEGQPLKDQYDLSSEQFEEQSPELLSTWTYGSNFKIDEQDTLRESYACDEDLERPFTQSRNNRSIQREVAQMPREATESDSDIPVWLKQFHYADSMSTTCRTDERLFPFSYKRDVFCSYESNDFDSINYSRKKRKRTLYEDNLDKDAEHTIRKTISYGADRTKTFRTVISTPHQHRGESKSSFDWHRYFRREGIFDSSEENDRFVRDPPSSIITVFDKKGNRVIFENPATLQRSAGTHAVSLDAEESFHSWEDQKSKSDITQSLMEREYLIFSEKMNQMLKNCKAASRAKSQRKTNLSQAENLMTIQFSRLDEQEGSVQFDETWQTLPKFKINVDMSERKVMREKRNYSRPLHLQSLYCKGGNEASSSKISDITKECAKSYNTLMNDVCTGKTVVRQNDKKRKHDVETPASRKPSAFCGRIKKAMFDNLHDNLNSVVRQACKIKYKFYILVTSADPFFKEAKEILEAEGHTAVEPYQFGLDTKDQTPLLIIIRNEDIAGHICDVPHLLELKKSSKVLFAGIDQPDDVVNLTHQELFAKGGFVVLDDNSLDTLTLENMKRVVGIMEELDKKGKWKWFLHYRDSRKLRENARCSPEAQTRKNFMDCCQEAGMVEVLPYHECDVISRDRPDYLHCLVCLQIQNASARFPVFITDTPAEAFEKHGILTMNIYTFSRILSNDTCSIS